MAGTDPLLPKPDQIQRLMAELLNRNVGVKPISTLPWNAKQPGTVATYVRDDKSLWLLWVCDFAFAGAASAALTLIPNNVVAAATKQGVLTPDMNDNLREVLNVGTALFNQPGSAHLRMNEVLTLPGPLPDDVLAMLTKPRHRLDLDINISGYGGGKTSLMGM